MFFWAEPKRVEQPGGGVIPDLSCWAACLSMWQSGTAGRKQETITALEDRFEKRKPSPLVFVPEMNRFTLDAGKFDMVAQDSNVNMAWRIIKGSNLIKWDLELLLNMCGYIYFVAKPPGTSGGGFSHARMMYGAAAEFKVGYFVDPSPKFPGAVVWDYSRMYYYDFIMGIDKATVPFWQDRDWQNT